jgi:MFS family permease
MRVASDFDVLRLRDFRLVFGAALVSLLGDGVAPLALTFAVLDLTGSATDLGVVLAARTIALVSSLLAGGVVADRLSRQTVMIGADLTRVAAQGAIAVLLVTGRATVAELAISQVFLGAATGFFNPASSGLLPAVAGEWVQQANSLRGMAMAAGSIAGPAIAGVLVVASSPGIALLIDAGTYAASAALLARVHHQSRPTATAQRFVAELRDGFAEVRARTWLWSTIVALSVVNAAGVAFVVLGAVIVKRQLGGASAWAVILAVQGVGALLGGSALLRFTPRHPLLVAVLIGLVPVVPTFLMAVPAPLALIAIAALMAGIGTMVFNTLWETTLQQHIPDAARSRVSSYDWFGSLALQSLGFAMIGPLAAAVGPSTALYLCGAVEFVAVSSLLLVREIRTLPPTPARTTGPADDSRAKESRPLAPAPVQQRERPEPG